LVIAGEDVERHAPADPREAPQRLAQLRLVKGSGFHRVLYPGEDRSARMFASLREIVERV
jgi:hypothetical protein